MKCNVELVYKNLRFKVLTIGKEKYILDLGASSFWKILFPFFLWDFPLDVYKVTDEKLMKKIVVPDVERESASGEKDYIAAISLVAGGLLYSYIHYLDMKSTSFISSFFILGILLLIVCFYVYVNIIFGKNLRQHLNLRQYPKVKLRMLPHSKQQFKYIICSYIFLIGLAVLFLGGSIWQPNAFMFFAGGIVLFMALGLH